MTKVEALKLALVIDEFDGNDESLPLELLKPIAETLRALAQPEHEPVGEIVDAIEGAFKCSFTKLLPVGTKLYTTPPKRPWVGLTDEEWLSLGCKSVEEVRIGLAIQAKLKEKNT